MSHSQFSKLRGIMSKMKTHYRVKYPKKIQELGESQFFSYALDGRRDVENLTLPIWKKLQDNEIKIKSMVVLQNSFEEMIDLTERGRLWHYPIDNEFGMDAEKQVPFEEHVFLDKYLEDFPKNERIRSVMGFVTAGLGRNPYMTVERKREAIMFYKDYFESKRDIYKQAGFDMDKPGDS